MTSFQLFDALPSHIEDALRSSIERFGVLVPITVDQDGNVLDGHHRKRIAEQMKVPYDRLVRVCETDDERRAIAHTLNADRRQLTEEQRIPVERDLRQQGHSIRAIAGALGVSKSQVERDLATVPPGTVPDRVTGLDGKSRPARRPQVIARDDREQQRAQSALSIVPDVDARRASVDVKRVERMARDADTEARRAEAAATVTELHGEITIVQSTAAELDVEADSIDLIFTDPPYPEEFLPAWSELAELAVHALKPGALVVAYTGQMFLPEVMRRMGEHLDYWWSYAIRHTGSFFQLKARHVQVGWKPLLVYRKPGGPLPPWTVDFTDEGSREKSGHDWQQAEGEAAYWIDQLTKPGDHIVDPFVGSGTTAAACKTLGRRFTGCDIDPLAVKTAQERVA